MEQESGQDLANISSEDVLAIYHRERNIIHYAYLKNAEKITEIEKFAIEKGYNFDSHYMDEDEIEVGEESYYALSFEKVGALKDIDDETYVLKQFLEKYDAMYDWWECETFVKG